MYSLIQYPTGKCFLDRMPEIVLNADRTTILSVQRCDGPVQEIFVGKYQPDFQGKIRIDISGIVRDYMSVAMPVNANDLFQSGFEGNFTFKLEDGELGIGEFFTVLNASPNTADTVEHWCSSHFLTEQAIQKPTNYESPEWLTYYDLDGDWVVVGRFYPKVGGAVDMIVKWDEKPGCWSVNVNYARLIPHVAMLPHQLKGFYDVILFDGSMNELARQRYLYDERTGMEHYYLFANPLGGIDTMIAQGENVLQPDLGHNIGRFEKHYKPLDDTEDMRKWQQNTGMLKYRWRNWLYGLIANKQGAMKYDPATGSYHPIVVVSSDIAITDKGQLANSTFDYIMDNANNVVDEEERYLSQSAADSASAFDDLTTEAVATVEDGATKPVEVMSEKVYVSFDKKENPERVYYFINGEKAGHFDPSEDDSPVVIDLHSGASIHFETDGDTKALTLNWYEGWQDVVIYGFVWSDTVCAELPDKYGFAWSEHVCAQYEDDYAFRWSEAVCAVVDSYAAAWTNAVCAVEAGAYGFGWNDAVCAQQYIYELIWEPIPQQTN